MAMIATITIGGMTTTIATSPTTGGTHGIVVVTAGSGDRPGPRMGDGLLRVIDTGIARPSRIHPIGQFHLRKGSHHFPVRNGGMQQMRDTRYQ